MQGQFEVVCRQTDPFKKLLQIYEMKKNEGEKVETKFKSNNYMSLKGLS